MPRPEYTKPDFKKMSKEDKEVMVWMATRGAITPEVIEHIKDEAKKENKHPRLKAREMANELRSKGIREMIKGWEERHGDAKTYFVEVMRERMKLRGGSPMRQILMEIENGEN